MHKIFAKRTGGGSIRTIYGDASFLGGLFKSAFPTAEEGAEVLRAIIRVSDAEGARDLPIELEGALLYGYGHEQLTLGRALLLLNPSERARFHYVTKVMRILVSKTSDLKSGQPPEIWPAGATTGERIEAWGLGLNDTRITLAMTTLLTGAPVVAAYLHDPTDCQNELGLSFDEWWHAVNGEGTDNRGGLMRALIEARDVGVIREIGVGCKDVDTLHGLLEKDPNIWDRFSVTRFSFMSQSPLLDLIEKYESKLRDRDTPVKLIAAGVYAGGILSRDPRAQHASEIFCNYRPATAHEIEAACEIWGLAEHCGMSTPMPAAIQFVARQPWLDSMVLGPRSAADVDSNAAYLQEEVPEKFWTELNKLRVKSEWIIDRRLVN